MVRKQSHGKPCPYCQRKMERHHPKLEPTREHSLPRSKGGTAAHVIIACSQCNTIKADMLPEQWLGFMARVPGWWKLTKRELRSARRSGGADFRTPGLWPPGKPASVQRAPVVVPPELIYAANDAALRKQALDMIQGRPSRLPIDPAVDASISDGIGGMPGVDAGVPAGAVQASGAGKAAWDAPDAS